jgi:hypothetical protein
MLNYSFAFGQDIPLQSVHFGNSAVHAAYAAWPVGLLGGFIPNIFYSLYLLSKHRVLCVPLHQQRLLLVVADGGFVDGSVCPLWSERGRPGTAWNFGRLVPLSDFHDYRRDPIGYSDRGMETKHSLWSIAADSRSRSLTTAIVLLALGNR